jgi:hypothetical protein
MTEYERNQMTPDDVAEAIARGDYMEHRVSDCTEHYEHECPYCIRQEKMAA